MQTSLDANAPCLQPARLPNLPPIGRNALALSGKKYECAAPVLLNAKCRAPGCAADSDGDSSPAKAPVAADLLTIIAYEETQMSRTVQELQSCYKKYLTNVNDSFVATTWMRLGKLYDQASGTECRAFARSILGATLAAIPNMQLQGVANVLWSLGRIKFDLYPEKLGPYLAKAMENRLLDLLRRAGFPNHRSCAQLWYGIGRSGHAWDKDFLRKLLHYSILSTTSWECVGVALTSFNFTMTCNQQGIKLDDVQRTLLTKAIESVAENCNWWRSDLPLCVDKLLFTAERLQLKLPSKVVKQLHNLALGLMPHVARALGRLGQGQNKQLCQQPAPSQEEVRQSRLLHDLGDDWTSRDFTSPKPTPRLCLHATRLPRLGTNVNNTNVRRSGCASYIVGSGKEVVGPTTASGAERQKLLFVHSNKLPALTT